MGKTSRSAGRPKALYPQEQLNLVLHLYDKNRTSKSIIKYMDVYHFSRNLFETGDISYEFTEYFWRKGDGRVAIDKMNAVYMETVFIGSQEDNKIHVVNTKDAVERYFKGKDKDKEKIIGLLSINENRLQRYIKNYESLKEKNRKNEMLLQEEREKNNLLKQKVNDYENILFMWLEASINDDVPLENLITTGKSRNPIVSYLFETAFSPNPMEGYSKFEEFRRTKKGRNKDNIVPFTDKIQKSILDDMDF
ncbi:MULTISPECIES: hypothetical protein [Robertmurraya]|uniref:Uncharacterized protein n=1 Tax=Robertmurraya beringensis TaxID=641660 RepID=A0ABV6KPI7_9BACI